MQKILLVEDDREIVDNLTKLLKKENFDVEAARTQSEAIDLLDTKKFSLILLDISLPDGSGYAVCSAAKADSDINKNKEVPIIFITAYDDEANVVTGLDMGGDDYITKPFRPRELVSRIKSTLRRTGGLNTGVEVGNLKIDTLKGTAYKDGKEVFLSVLEYKLLLLFMNNVGQLLTRNRLLNEVWDVAGDYVNDNTLTVYIKRMRDKIEDDPQNPKKILTVRGLGYKMEEK